MEIHVFHGPNLNLLGQRDSAHYGNLTLNQLDSELMNLAGDLGIELEARQTNSESTLVTWIQESKADGILLNAGGYTHTSVAIRDAISAHDAPVLEIHLSNIHARESFRRESLIAPVCEGQIAGLGPDSYRMGVRSLHRSLSGLA